MGSSAMGSGRAVGRARSQAEVSLFSPLLRLPARRPGHKRCGNQGLELRIASDLSSFATRRKSMKRHRKAPPLAAHALAALAAAVLSLSAAAQSLPVTPAQKATA